MSYSHASVNRLGRSVTGALEFRVVEVLIKQVPRKFFAKRIPSRSAKTGHPKGLKHAMRVGCYAVDYRVDRRCI